MKAFDNIIASTLPFIPKPIVWQFSKKYIAGQSVEDAMGAAMTLNSLGICTTLDVLGEDTTKREEAEQATQIYLDLLDTIRSREVDSGVSLKPTQLGLKLDKRYCFENIRSVVERAKLLGLFVRIDMEDHTCTTDTLDIYGSLKKEYSNVGVVVQAYLKRSLGDVRQLVTERADVRLCKGVYIEPEEIAIKGSQEVRDNFLLLLEELLKGGCYVGIATHDDYLVSRSRDIIERLGLRKSEYEFQMLLGVKENLRDTIVAEGDRMRVYVPFGEHWYAYCIRRLKENPTIAGYVVKNIFTFSRRTKS